jgi:hypothetical protein
VIQIINYSSEKLPFDIRGIRHIIYKDSPSGFKKLAKEIATTLKTVRDEQKGRETRRPLRSRAQVDSCAGEPARDEAFRPRLISVCHPRVTLN